MRRLLFAFLWVLLGAGISFAQNTTALAPQALPGLNVQVRGGTILLANSSIGISNTTVALSNNTTNYVFLSSAGVVQTNTTGFTSTVLPIATVLTAQGQIVDIQDNRPDYIFAGGGSGLPAGCTSPASGQLTCSGNLIAGTVTSNHVTLNGADGSSKCFQVDGATLCIPSLIGGIGSVAGAGSGQEGWSPNTDDLMHWYVGGVDFGTEPVYLTGVSGTDTYVSTTPVGALVKGQQYCFDPINNNTLTNPTLNINSLGAKTLTKNQGAALQAGDLLGAHVSCFAYNGTTLDATTGLVTPAAPVLVPNGTAAVPSYSFKGSTNFGMFNGGGVGLGFAANGVDAFEIGGGGGQGVFQSTGILGWTGGSMAGAQDTSVSRLAKGIISFANSFTQGQVSGAIKTIQTMAVTAADVTCGTGGTLAPCTSLTTITGLSVALPTSTQNWSFTCDLLVSQATAAAANQIGVQTATNGATNLTAMAQAYTAAAVVVAAGISDVASTTTAQSVLTFTPGAAGTKVPIHLAGTIEGASASGTTFNVLVLTGNAADLLTVYRGSSCWVY